MLPAEQPAASNVKTSGKGAPPPRFTDDGKIKPGEPIKITFQDTPTMIPPFEDKVKEDGSITLMYNKRFQAAGLTAGQLEQEIRKGYVPDWFQNLTATVVPLERYRVYYVEGEVKQPGQRPCTGPITLSQAITACGGFTDFASKTSIRLIRASSGRTEKHNWNKILSHPELDPQVYPNDKIHVKRSIF
jgi:polysaccharide export outer membrane protein